MICSGLTLPLAVEATHAPKTRMWRDLSSRITTSTVGRTSQEWRHKVQMGLTGMSLAPHQIYYIWKPILAWWQTRWVCNRLLEPSQWCLKLPKAHKSKKVPCPSVEPRQYNAAFAWLDGWALMTKVGSESKLDMAGSSSSFHMREHMTQSLCLYPLHTRVITRHMSSSSYELAPKNSTKPI